MNLTQYFRIRSSQCVRGRHAFTLIELLNTYSAKERKTDV